MICGKPHGKTKSLQFDLTCNFTLFFTLPMICLSAYGTKNSFFFQDKNIIQNTFGKGEWKKLRKIKTRDKNYFFLT